MRDYPNLGRAVSQSHNKQRQNQEEYAKKGERKIATFFVEGG